MARAPRSALEGTLRRVGESAPFQRLDLSSKSASTRPMFTEFGIICASGLNTMSSASSSQPET